MNLSAIAIEKRTVTYFTVLLLLLGGISSFFSLGQLEDPEFTVKTAVITTSYPGANADEVELEVTDRIELALQELHQVDYISSWSRAGQSMVSVEIQPQYWSEQLPQVWDEVRRKINDVKPYFPPGVGEPIIADDFGDVFGFQLAVVGDGYSYSELEAYTKDLKKELSLVEGISRIDLWGVQKRAIYLDVIESQMSELGLTDSSIANTLEQQNMVVDAGSIDVQERRFRVSPSGEFASPEDIGDLVINPSFMDSLQSGDTQATTELTRIRDIANVRPGYQEPPYTKLRYNGMPAIGISITNVAGANVVTIGQGIDQRLEELIADLPIGIEVQRVHWMSDIVEDAVNGFLVSFAQAVTIVLVVLTVFVGWRMGMIIGTALILTILGSFMIMSILGIDLQRMSLGALIIALGMMVDNAIVVADGMATRLKQGMERKQAAIEAASQPAWPLLGATFIAVMTFYPIFASTEGAGEYCRTLFSVVGISLLVSWLISVTVTPLQCMDMLPAPQTSGQGDAGNAVFNSPFYNHFRRVVGIALRFRVLTIGSLVALLVVSLVAFGNVKQIFFPDSSMTKFMVDVFAPEGTRIQQVSADLKHAESLLLQDERIDNVTSFIGAGPPRFYLPVDPESPNQSYAQMVVNVHDYRQIDDVIREYSPKFEALLPNAMVGVRKFGVGPSSTWKFELRISGPAVADPAILRDLGQQTLAILGSSDFTGPMQTDWRDPIQRLQPVYSQERARWASVTRNDIAQTTKRAFDGVTVGLYREQDELIPIVLRLTEEDRHNIDAFNFLQVQPANTTHTVPLAQVTDGTLLQWEDPVIARRDRRRTITVQANPVQGATLADLRSDVVAEIEALELPPGYRMDWGGEHEDTVAAQASLIPGVGPMAVVVLFIIIALFNAVRPVMVILLTIPFAAIGISLGLLGAGASFGFVALLGAMSLIGMMIKNAIVLLDQVDINLADGMDSRNAIIEAAVSRLQPVSLAAATTVLGVIPLLQDVFWIGMAITLMAGLSFGTLLTMILLPVFYAVIFRIPVKPESS